MITVKPKSEFAKCKFTEPTIIYVQTRKLCEKLYTRFIKKGIPSARYHGGMLKEDKEDSHELFINGKIIVIIATISFGMGIDKSDIRHVVNYGVPANIESYYQEIGRAGRDGINSNATIYYDECDFTTTEYLISLSTDTDQIKIKTRGMDIFRSYLAEQTICRQQMIDYYFDTGKFANEEDVINIPKCNMCDNCTCEHKQEMLDISNDAVLIYNIIKDHNIKNGFDFGLKKIIDMIYNQSSLKKTKIFIKNIIEILITKNVFMRYKAGHGFAVGLGKIKLKDILPLRARIDEGVQKINVSFRENRTPFKEILCIRDKIAVKHELVPSNFINDKVVMNIYEKSPKNIEELLAVDGISKDFIDTISCIEFMGEYTSINKIKSPRKKKSGKTRDNVYTLYKKNKSISEISKILEVKEQTIEGHIMHIFEHYEDEDINMEYVGLTEENENEIKVAVEKVGIKFLRPIKERVGSHITYIQIKVCLLVMKIES